MVTRRSRISAIQVTRTRGKAHRSAEAGSGPRGWRSGEQSEPGRVDGG